MTGPPDIRFYAGAPLVTSSGLRLGSLCVIDRAPRDLDADQLNVLCNFAEVVVREIEKDAARVRARRSLPVGFFMFLVWMEGVWPATKPLVQGSAICLVTADAVRVSMCCALWGKPGWVLQCGLAPQKTFNCQTCSKEDWLEGKSCGV